ncbi:MAG: cupin domain-containing protein [Pseudomonadota bacterium]
MPDQVLKKSSIDEMEGLRKTHFLNRGAQRINKSLGDASGLQNIGFHIVEVEPGKDSTELHFHHHEEECVYILDGEATATIGESTVAVASGDFIAYPAGGEPHKLTNTGDQSLRCIVVGQRLPHDVVDYPGQQKRLYRNQNLSWSLVSMADIIQPEAGQKT